MPHATKVISKMIRLYQQMRVVAIEKGRKEQADQIRAVLSAYEHALTLIREEQTVCQAQ